MGIDEEAAAYLGKIIADNVVPIRDKTNGRARTKSPPALHVAGNGNIVAGRDVHHITVGEGISLRDYFAAKCIVGLMSEQPNGGHAIAYEITQRGAREHAAAAYKLADALLAERENGGAT